MLSSEISIVDQLGQEIRLSQPAQRIVSLVPSQTELLFHLQMEDKVVGITKFCIHPSEWFHSKNRVGGTKNVDIQKVKDLRPDLIIANKEENTKEDIESLSKVAPVYVSDVISINDALEMIQHLSVLCGKEQIGVDLIDDISEDFSSFPKYQGKVIYFIWNDPYMVCGSTNFINSIIEKLGFENLIKSERYINISLNEIKALHPDYIFLSTEPFPFKEEHASILAKETGAEVTIVDGEMFSWYGSRMLKMKSYFKQLLA
ncbi:helical backbone metal receptor [Paracrocinitomix mangrovi]|uniref:ABC transporter substrate-binding protein n=1 Tax=Paracrocinitomix mangrovi TaxID=2862509 RepID=UPI001C8E7EC4|nr:helical backbone metal receptor [Paracrocinitomix mangrovi]UKN01640.1 helical backbone metal receptor [Paracrocinitomix mangrovi]